MTRLLNPPHPITVRLSPATAKPMRFVWQGITHTIERITQTWETDVDWWETTGRQWREYYAVQTTNGLLVVLYRDMETDEWFASKLYD